MTITRTLIEKDYLYPTQESKRHTLCPVHSNPEGKWDYCRVECEWWQPSDYGVKGGCGQIKRLP